MGWGGVGGRGGGVLNPPPPSFFPARGSPVALAVAALCCLPSAPVAPRPRPLARGAQLRHGFPLPAQLCPLPPVLWAPRSLCRTLSRGQGGGGRQEAGAGHWAHGQPRRSPSTLGELPIRLPCLKAPQAATPLQHVGFTPLCNSGGGGTLTFQGRSG